MLNYPLCADISEPLSLLENDDDYYYYYGGWVVCGLCWLEATPNIQYWPPGAPPAPRKIFQLRARKYSN